MQYHLNGFRPGDPNRSSKNRDSEGPCDAVDVLIVGCGPTGLTLASQLCMFSDIAVCIIDKNDGPLQVGRADGIACRSMEMFEAFGFADKVARESYWVNETTFWRPRPDGNGIMRADRIQDVEDDLSHMPHTILSQARVHDFFLDKMYHSPTQLEPHYRRQLVHLERTSEVDYPITAVFDCLDKVDKSKTVRARYVVGCDGARSFVRQWMGHELKGESARQLWGVMDVLVVTDFPDIRLKVAVQSANEGSMLIIPREGGYLVRLYIELDELVDGERAADRKVTPELLAEKASRILSPYSFDLKEVAWCSAYEIGQRVCDIFDDRQQGSGKQVEPRVFIAGDACHTHSPKAGQGMNVSMADAFNLGWKLASVIAGQVQPQILNTYSDERSVKARELIEFDRDMARLFSAKAQSTDDARAFQRYFQKHGRYTAGVQTTYNASLIIGGSSQQARANGLIVGKRFHSAPVIRLADAKPMQLSEALLADGRWRIVLFANQSDDGKRAGPVAALCEFLQHSAESPLRRITPSDANPDALMDVRAVFQQNHRDLNICDMPELLLPHKGRYGLIDYEKVFCADPANGQDVFDLRGIDRSSGALVIIRPDQFVSMVLPLNAITELIEFFSPIFTDLR